jgi:hypothetical protein
MLADHADAFAILIQQDRDGHKCTVEKCKESACLADTEIDVHGTDKVITGETACCIGGYASAK